MVDTFSKAKRSEIMSRIRSTGSKPEERLFSAVRAIMGPRWRIDRNNNGLPGRPDILIPSLRLVIFLDGCFYHSCPIHGHIPKSNVEYWGPKLAKNVLRDGRNRRQLRKMGYSVWRFWEHDFKAKPALGALRRLETMLETRIQAHSRSQNVRIK